jgi:hypothetical protein
MLNFICTTVVCVQQYLGTGYIKFSDGQRFIWDGFNADYVCTGTSNIYYCERIQLPQNFIQR